MSRESEKTGRRVGAVGGVTAGAKVAHELDRKD